MFVCLLLAILVRQCFADVIENFVFLQTVELPNTNFTMNSFAGEFSNISCTGISIAKSFSERTSPKTVEIVVGIQTMVCNAHFLIYEEYLPIVRAVGDVVVEMEPSTVGPLGIKINNATTPVTITTCSTNIRVKNMKFSHTISDTILNALEPILKTVLNEKWNEVVCGNEGNGNGGVLGNVVEVANQKLSKICSVLSKYLEPLLPLQPPELPPAVTTINWSQFPPLQIAESIFSFFGKNHSHVLNAVVNTLTHSSPGSVFIPQSLPLFENIWIPVLGTNASIELNNIQISHLNTFQSFDLSQPPTNPNNSISGNCELEQLFVSVGLSFVVSDGPFGNREIYSFNYTANAHDVIANGTLFLPVSNNCISQRTFGEIIGETARNSALCALTCSCFQNAPNMDFSVGPNITQMILNGTLDQLSIRFVSGDFLQKILGLSTGFTDLIVLDYSELFSSVLSGFVGSAGRNWVNEEILRFVNDEEDSGKYCEAYTPPSSRINDLVDLENSKFVRFVDTLVNSQLGANGTNALLDIFTQSIFGAKGLVSFPVNIISTQAAPPLTVFVSHVKAQNIDSISNIEVAVPISPYALEHKFSAVSRSKEESILLTLRTGLDMQSANKEIDFADTIIGMDSLDLSLITDFLFNQTFLRTLPLNSSLDCILSSFVSANISFLSTTITNPTLNSTNGTNSVGGFVLEHIIASLDPLLPNVLHSPHGMASFISEVIANKLDDAKKKCGVKIDGAKKKTWDEGDTVAVVCGFSGIVLVAGIVFASSKVIQRRRLQTTSENAIKFQMQSDADLIVSLSEMTTVAIPDNKKRLLTKAILLITFLGCVASRGMFLTLALAKIHIGAFTKTPEYSGEYVVFETDMLIFTFSGMVKYFWDSEAYIASLLIVIGTFLLPVLKMSSLIFVWFAPLKPKHRLWILGFFDHMGRYAFVDICFLAQAIILFKMDIPAGVMTMKLRALVCEGIVAGTISTFCLNILSHVMLGMHHKFDTNAIAKPALSTLPNIPVVTPVIFALLSIPSYLFVLVNYTITGVAGFVAGYFTLGFFAPSLASELANSTAPYAYGLVLSIALFMIIIIAPCITCILQIVLMVLRFRVPNSISTQKKIQNFMWFTLAWSGLDVLLWAIVTAILEINLIAVWIMNNKYSVQCHASSVATQQPCIHFHPQIQKGLPFLAISFLWTVASLCSTMYLITHPQKWNAEHNHTNDASSSNLPALPGFDESDNHTTSMLRQPLIHEPSHHARHKRHTPQC